MVTNRTPNTTFADNFDDAVAYMTEASAVSNQLIALTGDKDAALQAETVERIVNLSARLAQVAVRAYGKASGVEITPEAILGLLPDETPLAPPDQE
ncbi:MAG: hypothetical protein M3P27_02825 [Acidobacteriota bacterium]|nr:hypothetical protein [Acidobacteriota bacterium]